VVQALIAAAKFTPNQKKWDTKWKIKNWINQIQQTARNEHRLEGAAPARMIA